MRHSDLVDSIRAFVGPDTIVTADDAHRPTRLHFRRDDRVADCLIREAIAKARVHFPNETRLLSDVFVDFRDGLGDTRRRVET